MNGDGTGIAVFFYGTLMASNVLSRVITGQLELDPMLGIKVHKAVLEDHQRHSIKGRDYPAVRPRRGHTVLGTVAYNLSTDHLKKLDIFEGGEYDRKMVEILDTNTQKVVNAWVYIWDEKLEAQLSQENWDFDDFVKNKMHSWVSDEMNKVKNDPRGNRFWKA